MQRPRVLVDRHKHEGEEVGPDRTAERKFPS